MGDREGAAATARGDYPFSRTTNAVRRYTELQSLAVFWRDGFIDRYAGTRLVFPGTLRLLSRLLPEEFPIHPNWKMTECHMMFWELFPSLDHVVPVARGGADDISNWMSTSMLRNSAKAHWTLEELGWRLEPPGLTSDWDGLTGWFLSYVTEHPTVLTDQYLRRWHSAACRIVQTI